MKLPRLTRAVLACDIQYPEELDLFSPVVTIPAGTEIMVDVDKNIAYYGVYDFGVKPSEYTINQ